jgi:hypothetical protein
VNTDADGLTLTWNHTFLDITHIHNVYVDYATSYCSSWVITTQVFLCVFKLSSIWQIFSYIFIYFQSLVAKTTVGERLVQQNVSQLGWFLSDCTNCSTCSQSGVYKLMLCIYLDALVTVWSLLLTNVPAYQLSCVLCLVVFRLTALKLLIPTHLNTLMYVFITT